MRFNSVSSALLSALFLLPAAQAGAQSIGPSANEKGGSAASSGEESLSAKMMEPITHLRQPPLMRAKGECERKIKTVNVDGIIYVAILDCNDRRL